MAAMEDLEELSMHMTFTQFMGLTTSGFDEGVPLYVGSMWTTSLTFDTFAHFMSECRAQEWDWTNALSTHEEINCRNIVSKLHWTSVSFKCLALFLVNFLKNKTPKKAKFVSNGTDYGGFLLSINIAFHFQRFFFLKSIHVQILDHSTIQYPHLHT